MATTTTNFGWDIPQSSDLVKDGATAIAALGQDIDTAFVDFKGGTTGQVLKKTSNTDLDVEWGTASSGLTLINTTSFSAVSSQDLTGIFSSTYDNYKIILNLTGSTTSQNVDARMLSGSTPNTATNYRYENLQATSTTVSASRTTGATSWICARVNNVGQYASVIDIFYPYATQMTQGFNNRVIELNGNIHVVTDTFSLDVTTSYDGYRFFIASGTMTGTANVYGLAK